MVQPLSSSMNLWINMKPTKSTLGRLNTPFMRYFVMAGFVVVIELATFALLNIPLGISYLIATPLSNVVAIVLNWYFSRVFVFKNSSTYKTHVEITLVFIVSIIGILLQLLVSFIAVDIIGTEPIIGKALAILVVFFFSYWTRKRYIFKG